MKKLILTLFIALLFSTFCFSSSNNIHGSGNTKRISWTGSRTTHPRLMEPVAFFELSSSTLTIDFGDQPIEDYSVTISSPFTDVDYYVTSSYTTIPLVVDGISDYTIIIETSDGDVFEGTLAASEYSTTVMY